MALLFSPNPSATASISSSSSSSSSWLRHSLPLTTRFGASRLNRRKSALVVTASWQELAGGLIFSAIPFTAVKAVANSPLGERLRWRLEERKRDAVDKSFRLKALAQEAREARFKNKRNGQANQSSMVTKDNYRQNADLPRYYSKKEKKPFPTPILELRRAARERLKRAKGQPRRPVPPPRNGMLVRSLIPVSYEVLNARISLINNLKRLMKAVPVKACKYCNEIYVGPTGHPFKSCRGLRADHRKGLHEWTSATVEDVFVPVEAYHLFDRLGKRISHEERYSIARVPAIVELCIQAGLEFPDLPTKRRRKPVIRVGRSEIIDADEDDLPDPKPNKFMKPILEEIPDSELIPPANAEEIAALSESTLESWETLRQGTERLMKKYAVRVCGYCPEVHVGPSGHKAQNCGAYKHQQRNGQHGWQQAVLDDLIPPRYVWHIPETTSQLKRELRNFYGQAPAVVELCVQGGAKVPEQYKSTMRLDVGIPTNLREAEMVV